LDLSRLIPAGRSAIPHFPFPIWRSVLCLICMAHPLLTLRAGEKAPLLFRGGGGRRVHLWDGERISGQILELNKDTVRLRTAWAARLELPRTAVSSIEPLPGWRTIFEEDFRRQSGEPAAFAAGLKFTGEPAFADADDGTAARALVLRDAGQSLAYTLRSHAERGNEAVTAGRVGVNFQERGQARGARWLAELTFQQGERARRVAVTVAGEGEHYLIDTGSLKGTARPVARTPGWHRLLVQFSKRSLRVTCDDDVLWYNLDDGPGGVLQRVTLRCQRSAQHDAVRGAVAWTEFCVERAVDEHPRPPADDEQDAVRLLDDDQLFGRIVRADRRTIQIEARYGKRSLPWTAVSGCSFRRPAAPPKANEGAKVRVLVRSGLCVETDVLEGVVTRKDEQRLVLLHALLGEVTLERGRVRETRPLSGGAK
jgi:hypothetical protein